jgi:hypothetical protein
MGSAYERDHPGGLRSSIPDPKGRNVRFLPPILMADPPPFWRSEPLPGQ